MRHMLMLTVVSPSPLSSLGCGAVRDYGPNQNRVFNGEDVAVIFVGCW